MAHMIRSGIVEIISLFELQFNLVAQSCLTLCDPMDCSMPDFIVHHQLPELTQTHVHLVGDVIQLSHPLLSPSSLTFNLSQNQGLFKLVSSSHKDFPGASDCKSICLQCGRPGFDLWVGKIPCRRKWQSTPELLPGKSHGQRSLVGYSPWGHKESDMTEQLHFTSFSRQVAKVLEFQLQHQSFHWILKTDFL